MAKKKWLALFMATGLLLAACDTEEEPEDPPEEEVIEEEEEEEENEEETGARPLSDDDEEEEETGGLRAREDETADSLPGSLEGDMEFVVQVSDELVDHTPDVDGTMAELENLVLNHPDEIGEEDLVLAQYSGLYYEDSDIVIAIFLLSNRTEEVFYNFGFDLSVINPGGEDVFTNKSIYLHEEYFGALEPNTAMPLYVDIPVEEQDAFFEMQDSRGEITEIGNAIFEDEQPRNYIIGYNPFFVYGENNGNSTAGGYDGDIELVIPEAVTEEFDGLEVYLPMVAEDIEALVEGNDLYDFWTGLVDITSSGEYRGAFMWVNTTDEAFADMSFDLALVNSSGDVIMEPQFVELTEEEFGVLEPGTMMPFVVGVPEEIEDALLDANSRGEALHPVVDNLEIEGP